MADDIFTLRKKNQNLIDFSKSLNYRQMIVYSDQGNLLDRSYVQTDYQFGWGSDKPVGLWYSYGPAWIEYITNDYTASLDYDLKNELITWPIRRINYYTHIYQIYLNRKHIFNLTESQWDDFENKYKRSSKTIYWEKLEKDGWCGINIKFNEKRSKVKKSWYNFWDVSCGCIWDKKAIRKIKLLKSFNSIWYEER